MEKLLIDNTAHEDLTARLFGLLKDYALEKREVILASGQKSNIYLDCRQVYFRGEALFLVGELFFQKLLKIESASQPFDACGGMAMGSIPLSCALSMAAFRRGRELPGFAVRKEAKDHGMKSVIEGNKCLIPKSRVIIVEDVVTTASSAIKAIAELKSFGVVVDTLFAIVDREQGGYKNLLEIGVQLHSLFTLKDFTDV